MREGAVPNDRPWGKEGRSDWTTDGQNKVMEMEGTDLYNYSC